MKMNERLLRQWVRGILSEATILVTYDDGKDDEVKVPDKFAQDQLQYLRQRLQDLQAAPGDDRMTTPGDFPAMLEPGEEVKFTLENEDAEVQKIIDKQLGGKDVRDILGGPGEATPATRRKILKIFANFTAEEASQIQNNSVKAGHTALGGNWLELIKVEQAEPKVGKGEFAAALWYTGANVNPGAAEDLTVGGTNYHVKYYGKASEKSGLHKGGATPWNNESKNAVNALSLTVGADSAAAQHPDGALTDRDLKDLLINALVGNPDNMKFSNGSWSWDASVERGKTTGLFPTDGEAGHQDVKNALDYFGIPNNQRADLQDALNTVYSAVVSIRDEVDPEGEVIRAPVIIVTPDTFVVGQSEDVLTFKGITTGGPRGGLTTMVFGAATPSGWAGDGIMENYMLRSLIRESLLTEDLTKSDKKEIERIAKKQAQKYFNAELDKALGTSFFGYKGKVSKYVEDEVSKRFKVGDKDKDFTDSVEKISKRVLQALYAMHYQRVNLIKSMPVSKS
jgi:hypothetical protein